MTGSPQQHSYKPETEAFLRLGAKHTDNAAAYMEKAYALDHTVFAEQAGHLQSGDSSDSHYVHYFENQFGKLHPATLAAAMIEKRGFDGEDRDGMLEILEKSYPEDPVTGLRAKQCMPTIVGLAHLHALTPGVPKVPVCLVEGDLTNLGGRDGGCNKALGEKNADKLIHEICRKFQECFDRTGAELQGVRMGGDEVRFVIYGLPLNQVQQILDKKVHPAINLLAAQYGVHDLPHHKKAKGNFPGFGAAFAAVDLAQEPNPDAILTKLDNAIKERKTIDGMLRFGMINNARAQEYILNIYGPYLRETYFKDDSDLITAPERIRVAIESRAKELSNDINVTQSRWNELFQKGAAYYKYHDRPHDDPREFFEMIKSLGPETALENLTLKPETPATQKFPFHGQRGAPELHEDSAILRKRKMLMAFGFGNLACDIGLFSWDRYRRRYELTPKAEEMPPERKAVLHTALDLMDLFDAKDTVSRGKTDAYLQEDIKDFGEAHALEGLGVNIWQFELKNLGGLNAVSPDLANAVLREIYACIEQTLLAENDKTHELTAHIHLQDGMPTPNFDSYLTGHAYVQKGGKFIVLLPPRTDESAMVRIRKKIMEEIKERIIEKPVVEFAEKTFARRGGPSKIEALKGPLKTLAGSDGITIGQIPSPKGNGGIDVEFRSKAIETETDIAQTLRNLSNEPVIQRARERSHIFSGVN